MTASDNSAPLGLDRFLRIMRRRWRLILLCPILAAAAAYGVAHLQTKQYTATASLEFANSQLSAQIAGVQAVSNANPQGQQDTNVKLVTLGSTASQTAAAVGHGLSGPAVQSAIAVAAVSDTSLVTVAATSPSPTLAARIANKYAEIFISDQASLDNQYYSAALSVVNRQVAALPPDARTSVQGLALIERAQSLTLLAEAQGNAIRIAQRATVPTSPSSPHTQLLTASGLLLGIVLGLGAALLLDHFDVRFHDTDSMSRAYQKPVLAMIPYSRAFSKARVTKSSDFLSGSEIESFRFLRAQLRYFGVDRNLRTIVVTSAEPSEGKTTVACSLVTAVATTDESVLLLEVDLRRPTVTTRLSLEPAPGLSEVLVGATSLDSALRTVEFAQPGSRETSSFFLLSAGAVPPNPAELIQSDAMRRVLAEVTKRFSLVVIDTPPLMAVADSLPLLPQEEGDKEDSRIDQSRRDAAERLRSMLDAAGARVLGVAANGVRTGRYSYYSSASPYSRADTVVRNTSAGPGTATTVDNAA